MIEIEEVDGMFHVYRYDEFKVPVLIGAATTFAGALAIQRLLRTP